MPALKFFSDGEVSIAIVPYSEMVNFCATHLGQENLSVARLRNMIFASIENDTWSELARGTSIRRAQVIAPAVLYIPAGHIVLERSVNADAYGLVTN
eukprot:2919691-Alexandrium_andersonii.AAC.1